MHRCKSLTKVEFDAIREHDYPLFNKMLRACIVGEWDEPYTGYTDDMRFWIRDNATDLYFISEQSENMIIVYFSEEKDALQFKMVFEGYEGGQ